jgi:hypothetical protein
MAIPFPLNVPIIEVPQFGGTNDGSPEEKLSKINISITKLENGNMLRERDGTVVNHGETDRLWKELFTRQAIDHLYAIAIEKTS